MKFTDGVLPERLYGWKNNKGELVKPTAKQLFAGEDIFLTEPFAFFQVSTDMTSLRN